MLCEFTNVRSWNIQMILTLLDTAPSAPTSAPKGGAAPVDLLSADQPASFKSSINALINQAGENPTKPVNAAFQKLAAKLSQVF